MDPGHVLAGVCLYLLALHGSASSSSPPAGSLCSGRCDCQNPQHLMCTNRGLRAVPEPGAQVPGGVLIFSLGGNFIGNISALDFARYSSLVRLNLQYNQIQSIHPAAFDNLSRLEELYLGHNLLSDIPTGTLQPLRRLTVLYGNNNGLRKITPELFTNLGNLVKLRLDGNSIEVLQDSVFKSLTGLHYLHLESNKLQHIHRNAFSRLTNLRFLNLAHNRQSAVRSALTFSHLGALTTLLLSDNQIEHVGNSVFQHLSRLSKLALSNNRISRLDSGALRGLSSLRELLIDGNELQEIPAGLLDSLERVEELDFSRNRISNVDSAAFTQLKHLKVLKLKDNMLSSLSGDIFALNKVLYDLDLHGNNWTCDCRLGELKRWMSAAHAQGKLLTAFLRCHHPESLRGKYLDYVNSSQLLPLQELPHLCTSWAGPEESRGGAVLVKVEAREVQPARREGVKEKQGLSLKQGGKSGLMNRGKEEEWKGEAQEEEEEEEEEVQGHEGGVEMLAAKKLKKKSLRPRPRLAGEAVSTQTKGRRGSKVVSRDDPPATAGPGYTGNQYENSTDRNVLLSTAQVPTGATFDRLRSDRGEALPVITDPCVFNRHFITNVSVDHVTSTTVTVFWSAREHRRYTPGPGPGLDEVHYRILFDRFGTADRFPRYVYTRGSARSVTLRELSSDVTYMVCVEGVVGRSVCQVAPRDHCAGLVTLPARPSRGATLTSDLQLVTVATLAGNAVLLLVIGGIWLGRSLRRKLQRRKSAVHVRHMYSTRRPFRHAMTTASVSADFTSYQSSRPVRLAPLEEGDLIEFPCDRFLDGSGVHRDNSMPRFSD